MRKALGKITAIAILTLFVAMACFAQGPESGQFAQFREEHKYTFQLMQMVRHISEINKDPKYALTSAQAKQTLTVLKPLRSKSKLSQDQAKQALKDLKRVFDVGQLNAMAKIKTKSPFGGNRPGGVRPGKGGPGGDSARPHMRMDPNTMKNFNPFYMKADSSNPRAAQMSKRWNDFFNALERQSKQTKPDHGKRNK